MLRALLLVVVLANALFFAWSQGWLARVIGSTPYSEREPQRLDAQVRPETIKVLPAVASSAPTSASESTAAPEPAGATPVPLAPAAASAAVPAASAAMAASAPA